MSEKIKEVYTKEVAKSLEVALVLIQQTFSKSIGHHNEIKIIDVKIGNLKTRCTFFTEIIKEE